MTAPVCTACGGQRPRHARDVNGFRLFACDDCGLRFVDPGQVAEVDYDTLYADDGQYADKLQHAAELQSGGQLRAYPGARRRAVAEIERLRPASLLEVGCGNGDFLARFERQGVQCFGTDVSANALDLARRLVRAELHHGVLTGAAFGGRRFDVACAWEVLEHIADAAAFARVVYDRLEPGGWFYLSTPNYESPLMWADTANDPRSGPPVHVTFWSRSSVRRLLERAGFARVRAETYSVPANAARRSGGALDRATIRLQAALLPGRRRTLLAVAQKPAA